MASLPEDVFSQHQQPSKSNAKTSKPIQDLLDLLLDTGEIETDNPSTEPDRGILDNPALQIPEIAAKLAESKSEIDIKPDRGESEVNTDKVNTDKDLEIEPQPRKNLTLIEAVEYEAFLRQTVESEENSTTLPINSSEPCQIKTYPLNPSSEAIDQNDIQKRDKPFGYGFPYRKPQPLAEVKSTLADKNYDVEDLADSVNSLIPLITELLNSKINNSREAIIAAIIPVIDRIIEQRFTEDAAKMAAAIAKILPSAITEEIHLSPQAIAKAISPEIALAIEEQIRLDENAISHALGSEMGKAIKTQIELEKDAMVDALYPVIGNTISKYMVEVVQEINAKVENTLSIDGIKRKIRAKRQGISEAELIFRESVGYHVQAIFLIDKDSGLIIQEVQQESNNHLDSDLVAGMLTAIRSFANDCIASGSELDEIDYGDWQIPIEVAGYCYLAVVVKGEPSRQFREEIRQTLSQIVLKYGDIIQGYQGDSSIVPHNIKLLLQQLINQSQQAESSSKSKSSPTSLMGLLAIALSMIFIPWGIVNYQNNVASRIERDTAIQLDAAPELSVYRLDSQVSRGKLTLTGRVPSVYLRNKATEIGQKIASQENLELDNQIVAVKIPPAPDAIAGEIERLTSLLNRQAEIALETNYRDRTLTVSGFVLQESKIQFIYSSFEQIPGIERLVMKIDKQLPSLPQRIYFPSGSSKLNYDANSGKIEAIKQFLDKYPKLHLELIGYSDRRGSRSQNQQLAIERSRQVRDVLVAGGISPARLTLNYSEELPLGVRENQPLWLSRCVRLETFIPTEPNN